MQENAILPKGWKKLTVKDLFNILGGGTPSTSVDEYWNGEIPWITSADIHGIKDIKPRKKITQEGISNSATTLVPANSLIVVTRVSLGKIAITDYPLCFSQDSQALIPKTTDVDQKYALYYLSQAVQSFKYKSRGTTISGVTKKQLADLFFPLPELHEQKAIVSKIEELFSQLDAGVAGLKRARAALVRYRASVLKAAFEGRLVPQDLDDEPTVNALLLMGKKPIDNNSFRQLPIGWEWVRIADVSEINKRITNINKLPDNSRVTFVPMSAVDAKIGAITSPEERNLSDVRKGYTSFIKGDVIFAKITPCMENGKSAIVKHLVNGLGFGSTEFYVLRPNSLVISNWLYYLVRQKRFREEAKANFTGTAGQMRVPKQFMIDYVIPLPPMAEQKRIVKEIETRISIIVEIENTIFLQLKLAERLRQSILKYAFEGKLFTLQVSQNLFELDDNNNSKQMRSS